MFSRMRVTSALTSPLCPAPTKIRREIPSRSTASRAKPLNIGDMSSHCAGVLSLRPLKTAAALDAGLVPLLCVGEGTATDPEEAARFCVDQLGRALGGQLNHADQLILAYEPVWAIGASMPASPRYVNAVLGHLRRQVSAIVGDHAMKILIIYGGSAGPGLLGALCKVDGLFLGRYAHKPKNFGTVLEEATRLGRATVRSAIAIDETRSGRDSDQTSALRRRNIHD